MWSKASARTRISSGAPSARMRGARSPASTRAAVRAMRRSGCTIRAASAAPSSTAATSVSEPARRNALITPSCARSTELRDSPTLTVATVRPAAHDRPREHPQLARLGEVERRVPERRQADPPGVGGLARPLLGRLVGLVAVADADELGLVGDDRTTGHAHHEQPRGRAEGRLAGEVPAHRGGDDGGPLGPAGNGLRREGGGVLAQVVVDRPAYLRSGSAVNEVPGHSEGDDQQAGDERDQAGAHAAAPDQLTHGPRACSPPSASSRSAVARRCARACGAGSRHRPRPRLCRGRSASPTPR